MAHEHRHKTDDSLPPVERQCDVAVVGGSAAGLAAALQLVRQDRTVIVIDDGQPRNAPAAHMHGYLGLEGAAPADLATVGREEVRRYGGEILAGVANAVHRADEGRFRIDVPGGHAIVARRVLAATGLIDELPAIDGLAEHWGRDVIHCPFCHGYEVRDRRVVQIVTHPMGLHSAQLFSHLTHQLTIVLHDASGIEEAPIELLVRAGVDIVRTPVRRIVDGDDGRLQGIELVDGRSLDAEAVVVSPRFQARAAPFATAGLRPVAHPSGIGDAVEVDPSGQTTVAGLYAAGNVTDPSMQVLHAAAHGSRVGSKIAFDLAQEDLRTGALPSAESVDWDRRYSGDQPNWSGNPNGTLVHEVSPLAPGRALDVGAGEGADALWLAEQGWQVTAADISARALARISAEADQRGLDIECLQRDANAPGGYGIGRYDLVTMQYGAVHRTPDRRALQHLLAAVAPGGTLLVVGHDLAARPASLETTEQTLMYDPDAYVGVDEIAGSVDADPAWVLEVHGVRPRPPGAISTHHVNDVVGGARRVEG